MRFDIITIFPHIFDSYFNESIIKRAVQKKKVKIKAWNLRDFARDKHKKVDDKPYGGGAGMVLMAEPILRAVQSRRPKGPGLRPKASEKTKIVVLSAKGKQFNQKMAYDWSKKYKNLIFITGRYEGIDERVVKALRAEEISIGPYITTDGDVAVMVIISALTRLIPDVINFSSLTDESFLRKTILREVETGLARAGTAEGGLEYPHYTRPAILKYKGKKYRVPKVLLSGDHKKIEAWRNRFSGK